MPLLYVDEFEAALAFYVGQLGFQVTQSWEPNGELKWCRIERDGSAVMLQLAESEEFAGPAQTRGQGITFFFNCDDIEAYRAELTLRGLKTNPLETAFYGLKQLELTDPAGYHLCFQSPVKDS